MTPDELRKLALESSDGEYKAIKAQMEQAARHGSMSCTFKTLSDGAIQLLKDEGFSVVTTVLAKSAIGSGIQGWKVSY